MEYVKGVLKHIWGDASAVDARPIFTRIRDACNGKCIVATSSGTWPNLIDMILTYVAWMDWQHTLVVRSLSRRYRDLGAVNAALAYVPARVAMDQTLVRGITERRQLSGHDSAPMDIEIKLFRHSVLVYDPASVDFKTHRRYIRQCIVDKPRCTLTHICRSDIICRGVEYLLSCATHAYYYEWRGPGTITLRTEAANRWYTIDFNHVFTATRNIFMDPMSDFRLSLRHTDNDIESVNLFSFDNPHEGLVREIDIDHAPVYALK